MNSDAGIDRGVQVADVANLGVTLITGGTGSFGHAFLDLVLRDNIGEVRVFSRDEFKQEVMRKQLHDSRVRFYIGDVRDRASVDKAMDGVNSVFHAAALKEVPSCEFFPLQAVQTNVLGSSNVIESAIAHGVQRIVCLSTDKAVQPVNAMGMSKALMEKAAFAAARDGGGGRTTIAVTRYGNVICSRGSVIPLFMHELRQHQPLTITDPSMTRFLMSMDEAIELVLFAMEHAESGDLLIRKAPASTIGDLAEALKQMFSSDVPVRIMGPRHGEKTHETLATAEELSHAEETGIFYRVRLDSRDLNYEPYLSEGNINQAKHRDYTSSSAQRLTVEKIKALLMSIPQIRRELPGHASPIDGSFSAGS